MDTYWGAFEFWSIEDAVEIGVCDICGKTIYDGDEYDEPGQGFFVCDECIQRRIEEEEGE